MTDSLFCMQIGRGVFRRNKTARWVDQPSQFAWDREIFRVGAKDKTEKVMDKSR